jgi:shikimate kinase
LVHGVWTGFQITPRYNTGVDDRRHPARNIVLTGFNLCGKTSAGRELARILRRTCIDIPAEMDRRKRSIPQQLRAFRGEYDPHDVEQRLIVDLSYKRETIIAVGADTLDNPDYRAELEVFSFIVFIDPPFDVLWSRLQAKPESAPALAGMGRDVVHALWQSKRAGYERCELQLTHPWLTPMQLARLVVHCFFS